EEVMVTATKRKEKLQDVPVAVSALTSEDIAARGFTQYADYLNTVPGVYFEDLGPGRSQIRIRGLSTSEGGGASTVATYCGARLCAVARLSAQRAGRVLRRSGPGSFADPHPRLEHQRRRRRFHCGDLLRRDGHQRRGTQRRQVQFAPR